MARENETTPGWRVWAKRVLAFVVVAGMVVAFTLDFARSPQPDDRPGSRTGSGQSSTTELPVDGSFPGWLHHP